MYVCVCVCVIIQERYIYIYICILIEYTEKEYTIDRQYNYFIQLYSFFYLI